MAEFKLAAEKTGTNEGGWTEGKRDSGGETYKGISRNWHPNWLGWEIVDAAKPLKEKAVIENGTLDILVIDFYKKEQWDKIKGDSIPNQQFADFFFDFYFHKPKRSVELLQEILGFNKPDGVFGPKTLDALLKSDLNSVYEKYYAARLNFYETDPMFTNNIKGGLICRVTGKNPDPTKTCDKKGFPSKLSVAEKTETPRTPFSNFKSKAITYKKIKSAILRCIKVK